MKVIVTTVAPDIDAEIEPRFWRAAYLIIVDTETLQWEAVPHPGAPSVHAAGTRAALLVTKHGVQATISGDYGPNCYVVLEGAGIPMYLCGAAKTARAAVKLFRAGQLVPINAPISNGPHGELESAPAR